MLNMNHTLYKINILLNPIEAKILWSNRNTLSVNEIKRAYNTLPEFIEIRYGNKNEKIILLSTQAEYTSTESNIVNKFENVFTVNKIFEDVEIEAVYPSGEEGFLNYINNEIEKTFDYLWERKNFGKVEIQFKITEDGIVNDVDILPCNKTATNECLPSESWLALTLKNSIRNSPKWLPASLKGEKVHSIKRFTYNFPTDYSQTVKDAEFPGGKNSFTEYVQEKLKKHQRDLRDDGRSGTVVVIFSVDKYGVVTDIRPLPCSEAGVGNCLPPNSKLAEIAVRILQESPNWIPAEIKGHKVKAWRRLPLTYTLDE